MAVDLAGQSDANLSFWIFEHIDENDPEDGVFISDDNGISWAQILSLNGFPSTYQYVSLDLGEAAFSVGMSLVDGFRIKFQSRDNTSTTAGDGYSFDDIWINNQLYLPVVLRP